MISESSLPELYNSAVKAFPNTKKRQHLVHTIDISEITMIPFSGVSTLFIKCKAKNENKEYTPKILFKNIVYNDEKLKDMITIKEYGKEYYFKPPSIDEQVLVRCDCNDFYWRGVHFNSIDKSLHGKDRTKYEAKYNPGSANPMELPILCKHLMALYNKIFI